MQESAVVGNSQWTESERAAIADEMHCILASSNFKSSKRCQSLLRCMVEHALTGEVTGMKERTLGIEVFERGPHYDTSVDPIVRMTANEIRKRLAQWYQEPNHHHLVKIRLVAGSYLPEFEFEIHDSTAEPAKTPTEAPHEGAVVVDQTGAARGSFLRKLILSSAAILVVASIAVFAVIHSNVLRTTDYMFWKPLLDADGPLTVCLSDDDELANPKMDPALHSEIVADVISSREVPTPENARAQSRSAPWTDSSVAFYINGWFGNWGKHASLRPSSVLALRDFRQGPAVLIGSFNNPWALILLSNLRYSVRVDPKTQEEWIQDAKNPSNREWNISGPGPTSVDYALISRFFDTETGQWIVALGGLRSSGTEIAGTLITSPAFVHLLPASVRSQKNVQIVVKASMINDNPGPPQIVSVYTW